MTTYTQKNETSSDDSDMVIVSNQNQAPRRTNIVRSTKVSFVYIIIISFKLQVFLCFVNKK